LAAATAGRVPDGISLRAGMSVKTSIDTDHRRSLRELGRDIAAIFGTLNGKDSSRESTGE
jgi:hypothetical protein